MGEVQLPALGESVTEGVITAWLVGVGDEVEVDQPLVEISTDKVDTEVPSPVAGVVQELRADVDEVIEVGQVIAVVGEGQPSGAGGETSGDTDQSGGADDVSDEESDETSAPVEESAAAGTEGTGPGVPAPTKQALTSPLVRRLLRDAGIEPSTVKGTGKRGRITREDAERAIAEGIKPSADQPRGPQAPPAASTDYPPVPSPAPSAPSQRERPEASPTRIDFGGDRQVTTDLSRVRKAIANAMHTSLQSTAQLTAAVEVDVTRIMHLRTAAKDQFNARHGASLSPLPFFARAVCMTIPRHPVVNASIDLDAGTATYHNYINLGIAVDTDRGLVVPNIKNAQDLSIPGFARRIADIARKTRSGKGLTPGDIQGGTFTITNTGSRGTLWDTPILNPPEVAILATCAIEKRPVVVSDEYGDSIASRWMTYLCLTYDHRILDGADAARFLQDLKWVVENHDFNAEVQSG